MSKKNQSKRLANTLRCSFSGAHGCAPSYFLILAVGARPRPSQNYVESEVGIVGAQPAGVRGQGSGVFYISSRMTSSKASGPGRTLSAGRVARGASEKSRRSRKFLATGLT